MTKIRLQQPTGAGGARVLGLGAYRPRRRVTNDELSQTMETNDEWIQSRVGIAERRWASPDETLVEMSVAAGGKALAASGLSPDEIDLVVVASASLRKPIPGVGPQVAHRLGVPRPGAFDLNAGCAGFCYALGVANDGIRAGSVTNALVIGVERLTDVTDLTDRGTAVIFADGAGAMVIGASDEPGIGPVVWGSDGDQHTAISIPEGLPHMTMAGQAVYRWATTKLTKTLTEAMEAAGVGPADIDVFAPHQANLRIIELMAKKLKFPESTVIARDVVHAGNTSAASVPLALSALMESGEAKSGDTALLLGYGAGLTFAGQVITLP
jgi:3-oxoacyl-[acyl-carrier-protein] synthase-3